MWIKESSFAGLLAVKTIPTGLSATVTTLDAGRLALSSGNAELKFHSSSADAPLGC